MNTLEVSNAQLEMLKYALNKIWMDEPIPNDEEGIDCTMLDLSNTINSMVIQNKKIENILKKEEEIERLRKDIEDIKKTQV
tara:strand:- start:2020 stop:2262 length:243 start_codon:yes stop_codon:yes gene_type:complete